MKIAISGKGGSGKTTTAGTLARLLARKGRTVLAIDGDSNPNLGIMLGLRPEDADAIQVLPADVVTDTVDEAGNPTRVLSSGVEDVVARYGTITADGVRLLAMKRIDHAAAG